MSKKCVAITGISGGIGNALGEDFHARGFSVIGLDLDDSNFDSKFDCYQCDITNLEDLEKVSNDILKKHSTIDIWINNAGIARPSLFHEVSLADHQKVMDVNFTALMNATYLWQEKMQNQDEGVIVNIASVAGHTPAPTLSSYCASKHAVVGLTKTLQQESKQLKNKMRYVLVSPGFVDTNIMQAGENSLPENLDFLKNTPEDCAKKIVDGILAGKEIIEPTLDGKAMIALNRLLPKGSEMLAQAVLKKINKNKD